MPDALEYDHTLFEKDNMSEADKSLAVKFFEKSCIDPEATRESGSPKFKMRTYIKIVVPGTRDEVCRPARKRDIRRFADAHKRYELRMEDPVMGTPLKEWTGIVRSQVDELYFRNIKTVEDLANLTDAAASDFMGGVTLKQNAREWLEAQQSGVEQSQFQKEMQAKDDQLAAMAKQMEELQNQMASLNKSAKAEPKKEPKAKAKEDY